METPDLTSEEFWSSPDTLVLANPRDTEAVKEAEAIRRWIDTQPALVGHLLFRTSGSTGKGKWVALSKAALIASACAVNELLSSSSSDRWLQALPLFHVGGMGIITRAYIAGCDVIDITGKWDAARCHQQLIEHKITLASFVPTQLADLVDLGVSAPPALRAVLIGGGRLNDSIYQRASELGWPLRETYGMTETASQVATASAGDRQLKILPCWQVHADESGRLEISGAPLLSAYVGCENEQCFLEDPRDNGWLMTNDLGEVSGGDLVVHGRSDRCVKVLGELINLTDVEASVHEVIKESGELFCELVVMAAEGGRNSCQLVLCIEGDGFSDNLLDQYHSDCHPLYRIHRVVRMEQLPRTVIGKVDYPRLQELLRSEK